MAESTVPYVAAYGNITKALDGIKRAQTPDRFTQDFLSSKLGLSGGGAKPVIPFLKKAGFLGADGVPTDLYRRFRNSSQSGLAAVEALRVGFRALYEIDENIHAADDGTLKGVIVQATGINEDGSTVRAIVGSFKALNAYADHDSKRSTEGNGEPQDVSKVEVVEASNSKSGIPGLNLGYTINLHLPATSDITVYNAIFKSLRDHILG